MDSWTVDASADDLSVNFVRPAGDGGLWDARYVRQTTERGATVEDYLAPADVVLAHLDRMEGAHGRPDLINVNLMAWGDPLANPNFLSGWRVLSDALLDRAGRRGMGLQLNVSTIMPSSLDPAFVAEDLGGGRRCASTTRSTRWIRPSGGAGCRARWRPPWRWRRWRRGRGARGAR